MKPLVSVIIPTYNRAKTIARSINILLQQTYSNLEVIVVEDGSIDETVKVLDGIKDDRLRIIYHETNRGVTAAKNTGLNNIQGEWFTILDSDDEVVENALEILMQIPLEKDGTVTAVSCNCIDTTTGLFSGQGVESDQYIDFKTLVRNCKGEYWGITKTELLSKDRFNERLKGYEDTLWYKINERAKRFYIHKGLRIYHTEGSDRISIIPSSIKGASTHYQVLMEEEHYLEVLRNYLPQAFARSCLRAVTFLVADKRKEQANFYYSYLKKLKGYSSYKIPSFFVYHSNVFINTLIINFLTAIKIIK